jgi:hypothetical protein
MGLFLSPIPSFTNSLYIMHPKTGQHVKIENFVWQTAVREKKKSERDEKEGGI